MSPHTRVFVAMVLFSGAWPAKLTAQHSMPPGMTHEQHMAQLKKDADLKSNGDAAMGFNQDAVTHHFRLLPSGGEIVLTARHPNDGQTLEQIRRHLEDIATAFASGDFQKPLQTHGEIPPGVDGMQRYQSAISYTINPSSTGGAVRLTSVDAEAIAAVHEFLRYQITEHKTGDPLQP